MDLPFKETNETSTESCWHPFCVDVVWTVMTNEEQNTLKENSHSVRNIQQSTQLKKTPQKVLVKNK